MLLNPEKAPVKVPFLNLQTQHDAIRDHLARRLERLHGQFDFIQGEDVKDFEVAFAHYCGAGHCVGVANGTDALALTLRALDIGPGDEVITAANSFIATAEAIVHAGATPVLADVDPVSRTLDPRDVERRITPRTRALLPVHLYGRPTEMEPLTELASAHRLAVLEDAAQAHGALYRGRRVGSLGDAACFSFYPSKNLGAYGDAGAVTTNDEELAERLRKLANHGGHGRNVHEEVGFNSRLDSVQAAVLAAKLGHLEDWNVERRALAERYDTLLRELPAARTPAWPEGATHVWHLYVVRVPPAVRDRLVDHLQAAGVQTGVHYPLPIHLTPAFRHLGHRLGDFPVSEELARSVLSLPLYPGLSTAQAERVVAVLGDGLAGVKALEPTAEVVGC